MCHLLLLSHTYLHLNQKACCCKLTNVLDNVFTCTAKGPLMDGTEEGLEALFYVMRTPFTSWKAKDTLYPTNKNANDSYCISNQ